MMVQFIFMTIAFVIMLIVAIIQNRTIKRLEKTNEELWNKKYSEYMGFGIPYKDIVERARLYIHTLGGFEKFAEWGLIRANTD